MQTNEMILAEELCNFYKIEYSFINDLHQFGLLEVRTTERSSYVPHDQLQKLEQIIRLHHDLNINIEGIDAISNLLDTIKDMQNEIVFLRNRLKLYEEMAT